MKSKLYLECCFGISGDMFVASLLDLGADEGAMADVLNSLPINGFHTKISRVKKAGLDVCDFAVILDEVHENHDHDMEYLHGEEKDIHKEQDKKHLNHLKSNIHVHRSLPEILDIIEKTSMTEHARQIAGKIFLILAKAESKAHGVELEQVHFHEVGAVDSIVDIVAAAVCIDNLGVKEVIVPVLYEGTGFIRCQHGTLPVPVPAVSNIVAEHGLKLHITENMGEFVTPTGAAIVAAIQTSDQLPKEFVIKKIGIGAGKRNYERPSMLRALLIEEDTIEADIIYKLESNIDDCSPQALGFVMERLFENGAKDVYYIPVFMKKNRPAYQLNVLCKEEEIANLEQIIFEETTTIGIRRQRMERSVLKREIKKYFTSLGEVKIKICKISNMTRYYPEYESVVDLCKKHKIPFQEVYQLIGKEIAKNEINLLQEG
ncbi:nickel pincer cofactor biosynthesis protein LarC [Lachnotalea glycerini]|uniref:Pyridinium-3,5-bisthiocarboxylic acid mononucleotide nickel insertion protein n=1 Tax=Lachnotalea glycerini TaxID=1763509 RepID=A0A371JFM3_9FIRM|nr:nickel pincer cofactor biosynthesis protein LarC [Lachnotalea glycerini]RDY31466.1 nickel pincer cofactor biosynthesis protein LarC [Lachnotalea glycerini]